MKGLHEQISQSPYLKKSDPYFSLAGEYLNLVLQGERHQAHELILHAVKDGVAIKDIYLHIFQPVLYEIGRLWEFNEITVAQELAAN